MSTLEKKPNITSQKVRLIFMGTPEFALPGFSALIDASEIEIVGVFTQTDKPVGRKQIISPPPVKEMALKHGLRVFQPKKINLETETIRALKPDLIVVIAYGKIIPPAILDIPTYGCVNVHASLLPKYRGAACLNAPILNGDSETGVTIMRMETGLDTGPILRQAKIKLNGRESLKDVHDNLSALGAEILVPTLKDLLAGKIIPQAQDDSRASYIKTLSKENGRIDWNQSASAIERMVRAYNPWPGTSAVCQDRTIKIIAVENEILKVNGQPTGQIFRDGKRLAVQCGQDSLVILKLQIEGKKAMTAEEFLNGNPGLVGKILE
ncbi:MAG: methionyl-tRNA formyltransferase [Patescibacteria group bacterium]|jgi:methionyl-tRNA formyltransferase